MVADETTFLLAFTAVFTGVAWIAWATHGRIARLQARLDALEAMRSGPDDGAGPADAKAKTADAGPGPP